MLSNDIDTADENTSLMTGRAGMIKADTVTGLDIPDRILGFQIISGTVTVNSSKSITDDDTRAENISGITYEAAGEWFFPAREVNITTTGMTIVFLG